MLYIVLGVIFVIIIWAILDEVIAQKNNEYYQCYCKMFFRGTAKENKCAGLDTEFCKHCKYRRNYNKEIV